MTIEEEFLNEWLMIESKIGAVPDDFELNRAQVLDLMKKWTERIEDHYEYRIRRF